jgi:hypothetical protein
MSEPKYGVKSIKKREHKPSPSHLFIVRNPPSDVDPKVTDEQLDEALLRHCETSHNQLAELNQ